MSDFYTLLTNAGLAAVTNAALTGTSVDITHMAVGDGEGLPVQSRTTLRNEVWRGALTRIARSTSDGTVLECETRIPPEEGGWTVREVGLFNEAGILLAIGNLPDSYKPILDSGSAKDMQIRMYIQHSNADTVTLKVDPAIVMASQSFVQDVVSEAKLQAAGAQVLAMDAIVQLDLERDRTAALEAQALNDATRFRNIESRLSDVSNRASRAILN